MRRMADRRGLDSNDLQAGLGSATDRDQSRAVHLLQEPFEDMEVLPDHAALGQPVGQRPRGPARVPREGVPEEDPVRLTADRVPDHAARRLQPQGRIAAGRPERLTGPGQAPVVWTAELALAGERDPGEPSTAEPESLAEENQSRPAHPLQIRLQVAPPLPRPARDVEIRMLVAIRVADAVAVAAGTLVQPAEEGLGDQDRSGAP
jgi:hypothetical protein